MALSAFILRQGDELVDMWFEGDKCHSHPFVSEVVTHELMRKIFAENMALSVEDGQFTGEQDMAVHKIIETPLIISEDGSIIRYDDESSVLIQSTTAQWATLRSAA